MHHPHRQHRRGLPHLPPRRRHRHRAPSLPTPKPPPREAHDKSQGLRFTQTAAIKNFDASRHLDSGILTATDRTVHFAVVAARQAAAESQLTNHYAPDRIAIIVGCACGGPPGRRDRDRQALHPRRPRPSPHRRPHHGLGRRQQHLHRPQDHRPRPQHLYCLLLRHSRHRPRLPDDPRRHDRRRHHRRPRSPPHLRLPSRLGQHARRLPPPPAAPSPPTATA